MERKRYITEILGQYVARSSYRHLPTDIVEIGKTLILDSIGCMFGGTLLKPSKIVNRVMGEVDGPLDSTIVPVGKKVPTANAAYINAYLANSLDFDDTVFINSTTVGGHLGSVIIPSALSVAEKIDASGKELINAVVLGYEIAIRIGYGIAPTKTRAKTVSGMATWEIFGATTAAAKLLKLDPVRIADTYSLAAVNAPVSSTNKFANYDCGEISWAKNNFGWAAMGGIIAAQLASHSFRGNRTIFNGPDGFWAMAGSDQFDTEKVISTLGEDFKIRLVSLKPYPSCRYTHSTLDAIQRLKRKNVIKVDNIKRINVYLASDFAAKNLTFYPRNVIDAQFSLPFLAAVSLMKNFDKYRWILREDIGNRVVLRTAQKIRINRDVKTGIVHKENELACRVTVEMKSSQRLQEKVMIPRGDPRNPMSIEEIQTKFVDLVTPSLRREKTLKLMEYIHCLDQIDKISTVTHLLAK